MASTSTRASKRTPYHGPTFTHHHPALGSLTGRVFTSHHFEGTSNAVVQFRSIPYALVEKRFAPCSPLSTIPAEFDDRPHRDFTQFGAACPQAVAPEWYVAYGGLLEDDLGIDFDEFTCLTVSISVPESQLSAGEEHKKLLPVMVYVHGGGAQEGVGHVDGLHSNAPLAAYASSLSKPVVTVNVGYRLNWFGSLVCRDVMEEYQQDSTSAYGPFNHFLQDQRAAFGWIRKFIGGFGGDPDNVTAFGESAGSILLVYHICGPTPTEAEKPLFNRAILQSGLIMGHMSFEQKEAEYQGLLRQFNITGATRAERLKQLRNVPAEELTKHPGAHLLLFVDDIPYDDDSKIKNPLFPHGPATYSEQMSLIPSCPWLEDVIIGDSFWEGHVLLKFVQFVSAKDFVAVVLSVCPRPEAVKLLEAYDIPTTVEAASQMDRNLFLGQLSYFTGDLTFSGPYHKLAGIFLDRHQQNSSTKKVYRYSFGLSNPFPGSHCSFATGHHFVEILFVFLTLLDRYPRHRDNWLAKRARETAKRWITFAHREPPWEEYAIGGEDEGRSAKIAICDDLDGWTAKTLEQDEQDSQSYPWGPRRYAGWRALDAAMEALRGPAGLTSEQEWETKVNGARMRILSLVLAAQASKTAETRTANKNGDNDQKKEDETNREVEVGETLTDAVAG